MIKRPKLRKVDIEEITEAQVEPKTVRGLVVKIVAAVFAAVFLYQAAFGVWQVQFARGLYIFFALFLTFLSNPRRKKEDRSNIIYNIIDFVLIGLTFIVIGYFIIFFVDFTMSAGIPLTSLQLTLGIITIGLVLEASRRTVGLPLVIIAGLFLLYAHFGNYMPGALYHRGYSLNRIISVMYTSTEGIFGSVVYTFSTFIFLFIIFGAFLSASGAGQFFIELAKAAVGRFTGGAAQSAVFSSWMIGSVIGSSTANTAITGSITIPMMINRGYRKHVAAAVEAVVSIGGQFMPPIMGAAAFLMAAFIGVPYLEIARAALIPALLFFLSMVFMVYLEARRFNLRGIPKEELPPLKGVLLKGWYYFVPITIIIVVMARGYSPALAGFWSIVASFVISWFRRETRMTPRKLFDALSAGGKNSLSMATTAGTVGILIAAIALPGLGMKVSSIIIEVSGGSLPIALILVMAASFVLGMGMNVTSAYLILVTMTAPALVQLGIPLITAHFFVFWTSQLSVITPPVALSSYVAAAIAKADVWKTGWYSLRMGLAIYYIPIMFVFIPSLLWMGTTGEIVWAFATTLIGVLAFSSVMQGYLFVRNRWYDNVLLGIASLTLVLVPLWTDFIGVAVLVGIIIWQKQREKQKEKQKAKNLSTNTQSA
jgi:TRAP transporter 4TM/12TM fusion protein